MDRERTAPGGPADFRHSHFRACAPLRAPLHGTPTPAGACCARVVLSSQESRGLLSWLIPPKQCQGHTRKRARKDSTWARTARAPTISEGPRTGGFQWRRGGAAASPGLRCPVCQSATSPSWRVKKVVVSRISPSLSGRSVRIVAQPEAERVCRAPQLTRAAGISRCSEWQAPWGCLVAWAGWPCCLRSGPVVCRLCADVSVVLRQPPRAPA